MTPAMLTAIASATERLGKRGFIVAIERLGPDLFQVRLTATKTRQKFELPACTGAALAPLLEEALTPTEHEEAVKAGQVH